MSTPRNRLHDNDVRFIEYARGLSDAEWSRPSLCTAWSNRDVLAHLVVGYSVSTVAVAIGMAKMRGSFDRANAALARDMARRRTPPALIGAYATLLNRPRGIGRVFPRRLLLGDHVIHELDIVFALDREPTIDTGALVAVLDTQVRLPNPFVPAAARARGLSLRATDADWAFEDGVPMVAGRAAHLASVLAGRPWALSQLTGDGVDLLRARM
jgi:uncharacterized protein (TIGR03083 family)